jgi:DNA polymerase type B, organellar and viral
MYAGPPVIDYSDDELSTLFAGATDRQFRRLLLDEINRREELHDDIILPFVDDKIVVTADLNGYRLHVFNSQNLSTSDAVGLYVHNTFGTTLPMYLDPVSNSIYAYITSDDMQPQIRDYLMHESNKFKHEASRYGGTIIQNAQTLSSRRIYTYHSLVALSAHAAFNTDTIVNRLVTQLGTEIHDSINAQNFTHQMFTPVIKMFNHTFESEALQRRVTFKDRTVTTQFTTPLILNRLNITGIANLVASQMAAYQIPGYRPYMITYTKLYNADSDAGGNNLYKNSSPHDIEQTLIDLYENYEGGGGFLIDCITYHYTGSSSPTDRLDFAARFGEGTTHRHMINKIPTGYWFLDIGVTKSKCILNAFIAWMHYCNGAEALDELYAVNTTNLKGGLLAQPVKRLEQLKKYYKKEYAFGDYITSGEMRKIMPHQHMIISKFDDETILAITPEMTKQICVYVVDKNHAQLLIHEDNITLIRLKDLLQRDVNNTYVTPIRMKKSKLGIASHNVADIESYRLQDPKDPLVHVQIPIMIGAIVDDVKHMFKGLECLDNFMYMLTMANKDLTVWMHYGGRYDHHVLFDTWTKFCDKSKPEPLEILDLNGNLIQVKVHLLNKYTITFKDSYRIIPLALSKFKDAFNLNVGKMTDVDVKNVNMATWLYDPIYAEYCMLDCITLQAGLIAMEHIALEVYGINPLNYVSCSSTMKALFYSKYYDPRRYKLVAYNENMHMWTEPAYGGGITDLYHRGTFTQAYCYDYTSLYPWAGTQSLPYGIPIQMPHNIAINTSMESKLAYLNNCPGIYEIVINSTPNIPVLFMPIHHMSGYTSAHLTEWYGERRTSIEIIYCIELGYDIDILGGYHQPIAPFMSKFFNDLFKHKVNADTLKNAGMRAVSKSYLVNSYGFMGFKKYNRSMMKVFGVNNTEAMMSVKYNCQYNVYDYNKVYIGFGHGNALAEDVNISVATWITAHSRIRYHKLISAITYTGYQVYYGDTDSAYTNCRIEDVPHLRDEFMGTGLGTGLGELKREHGNETILSASFIGLKLYTLAKQHNDTGIITYINKIKGVSTTGELYINDERVDHLHNKDEVIHASIMHLLNPGASIIYKFNTMMTGRQDKINGKLHVRDKLISKVISATYTKGVIDTTGKVYPLYIPSNRAIV